MKKEKETWKQLMSSVVTLIGAILVPLPIALVVSFILKGYGIGWDEWWSLGLVFWLGPAAGNAVFFLGAWLLYILTTRGKGG